MNPTGWPLWLRCQIIGLLWGGYMYGFVAEGPRTLVQLLIHLAGAVLFGLAFWALARVHQRRQFGDLTDAERDQAVDAVRTAQPPADPRVAEAAVRLATRWTKHRMRPAYQVVFYGFFVLLAVYLAIWETPWAWFGVAFWPLVAWFAVGAEVKQRRAAERFLQVAQQH